MMGGRMIVKNISLENYIYLFNPFYHPIRTYLAKMAVNIPMKMAIVD